MAFLPFGRLIAVALSICVCGLLVSEANASSRPKERQAKPSKPRAKKSPLKAAAQQRKVAKDCARNARSRRASKQKGRKAAENSRCRAKRVTLRKPIGSTTGGPSTPQAPSPAVRPTGPAASAAPSTAPAAPISAPTAAIAGSNGPITQPDTSSSEVHPTPSDFGGVAGRLFNVDYGRGLTSWQAQQQPDHTQRITVTGSPGSSSDPLRPATPVMRVELQPGDLTDTSGYVGSRAEVYGRAATPMSLPADRWPDPPGSVRWYGFSLFVPSDFPVATDARWLTLTQWKGLRGGSPPLALEIKRGNLRLGGARSNAGLIPNQDLGPLPKDRWTRLVVGLRLSSDRSQGWVEVYRDGVRVTPRTSLATMDTVNGAPDPIYLKQGIYRDSAWNVTQVLYFGPAAVAATRESVW